MIVYSETKKEVIYVKNAIKKLTAPILLLAANIALFYYYGSGLTEYNSVLDRYLNFWSMFMILAGSAVCAVSAVICAVFLIVRIIRIKKNTSKVFPTVLLTLFIVIHVACFISVGALHSKSDVLNFVSETAYSYVDFDAVFGNRNEASYHEQTVLYTVTDEIPVNYKIEQSDLKGGVQTNCVKLADDELLEFYYSELAGKYADYNVVDFDGIETDSLGISKGFYYTIDNASLGIVVIKDNAVFNISIDGRHAIDDVISEQIRSL